MRPLSMIIGMTLSAVHAVVAQETPPPENSSLTGGTPTMSIEELPGRLGGDALYATAAPRTGN
jgi:hypothetical protein